MQYKYYLNYSQIRGNGNKELWEQKLPRFKRSAMWNLSLYPFFLIGNEGP